MRSLRNHGGYFAVADSSMTWRGGEDQDVWRSYERGRRTREIYVMGSKSAFPTPPGAAAADGNGADREFQRECVREGREVLEEEEGW